MKKLNKLKLLVGRFMRSIVNEVVNARINDILDAGTSRSNELVAAISEIDVYGGLLDREEFIKKLKHIIKLIELRKEWIDASIYNSKEASSVEKIIKLEKTAIDAYHEAMRDGEVKEIARAEGRLEVFDRIRKEFEK